MLSYFTYNCFRRCCCSAVVCVVYFTQCGRACSGRPTCRRGSFTVYSYDHRHRLYTEHDSLCERTLTYLSSTQRDRTATRTLVVIAYTLIVFCVTILSDLTLVDWRSLLRIWNVLRTHSIHTRTRLLNHSFLALTVIQYLRCAFFSLSPRLGLAIVPEMGSNLVTVI